MVAVNYLWNPINDNIVREFDDAGATSAEYTTEPNLYGNVVSQHRNGQTSYLLSDGQGNTTELTNDAGTVTDTIRYSAFGEVTERTGTTECPFQYVGQRGYFRDAETACNSVRWRTLFPHAHRWLSRDPVFFDALHNLYAYVSNRATLVVDPSGLAECRVLLESVAEIVKELIAVIPPGDWLDTTIFPTTYTVSEAIDAFLGKSMSYVYAARQTIICKEGAGTCLAKLCCSFESNRIGVEIQPVDNLSLGPFHLELSASLTRGEGSLKDTCQPNDGTHEFCVDDTMEFTVTYKVTGKGAIFDLGVASGLKSVVAYTIACPDCERADAQERPQPMPPPGTSSPPRRGDPRLRPLPGLPGWRKPWHPPLLPPQEPEPKPKPPYYIDPYGRIYP